MHFHAHLNSDMCPFFCGLPTALGWPSVRTAIATLILIAPPLIGGYLHHRQYEPYFWERRSFWSFANALAMLIVVVMAALLLTFGAKALVGVGRNAAVPLLLVGGGASVVAFSRASLGRIGSAFTDITGEFGSLVGWFLLILGALSVVISSANGQPGP